MLKFLGYGQACIYSGFRRAGNAAENVRLFEPKQTVPAVTLEKAGLEGLVLLHSKHYRLMHRY